MAVVEGIVRDDAGAKGGGDVIQTRAYLEMLRSAGHDARETTVTEFARTGGSGDIALVFNTARPMEWVQSIRCSNPSVGVVGVPIHHPESWFDDFEKHGRHGVNRLLGLVRPHTRRSAVKATIRRPAARTLAAAARPSLLSDAMRTCVDRIDAWVFLAEGEQQHLEADLARPVASPAFQVRNGVDDIPASGSGPGDAFDVLIVGRVEERKNVTHAVRALAGTGLTIGVIGDADKSCARYVRGFERTIADVPTARYLGPQPRERVLALMDRSSVYVSTSWFEVVSLAELEAAAMGMQIVGTERSFSGEYIPDRLAVDPQDRDGLVAAVTQCIAESARVRNRRSFPWRADAPSLLEAVEVAGQAAARRGREDPTHRTDAH